jgi:hypothetical protein
MAQALDSQGEEQGADHDAVARRIDSQSQHTEQAASGDDAMQSPLPRE